MSERIERLKHLLSKYPEPWVIEKEPHSYNDGTKEFTHVRYKAKHLGREVTVSIGEHVTPDLAELLVLLRECAVEFSTPPAVAVPDGWQLVPKEMTEEMIDAALRFDVSNIGLRMTHLMAGMYRAALAVAPPPQNKGETG